VASIFFVIHFVFVIGVIGPKVTHNRNYTFYLTPWFESRVDVHTFHVVGCLWVPFFCLAVQLDEEEEETPEKSS